MVYIEVVYLTFLHDIQLVLSVWHVWTYTLALSVIIVMDIFIYHSGLFCHDTREIWTYEVNFLELTIKASYCLQMHSMAQRVWPHNVVVTRLMTQFGAILRHQFTLVCLQVTVHMRDIRNHTDSYKIYGAMYYISPTMKLKRPNSIPSNKQVVCGILWKTNL